MTYLGEDQTRWINCPRCDEIALEVQCGGFAALLSRRSVPYSHAAILSAYGVVVWQIWHGALSWHVRHWHRSEDAPQRGRLYLAHDCTLRK